MIGMVNAAGTVQAVREHPAARPTDRQALAPDVGEPPMWVREPKSATSESESARAVTPVEFQVAEAQKEAPAGEGPAQVDRTEAHAHPEQHVGQRLDTTA